MFTGLSQGAGRAAGVQDSEGPLCACSLPAHLGPPDHHPSPGRIPYRLADAVQAKARRQARIGRIILLRALQSL